MANGQTGRSGQLATKHVDLETEPGPGPVLTLLLWALEQIAKVMLTTLKPAKFRYAQLMVPGQTGQSGAHVLKPVVVVPEPGPGHAITLPQLATDWTVGLQNPNWKPATVKPVLWMVNGQLGRPGPTVTRLVVPGTQQGSGPVLTLLPQMVDLIAREIPVNWAAATTLTVPNGEPGTLPPSRSHASPPAWTL